MNKKFKTPLLTMSNGGRWAHSARLDMSQWTPDSEAVASFHPALSTAQPQYRAEREPNGWGTHEQHDRQRNVSERDWRGEKFHKHTTTCKF